MIFQPFSALPILHPFDDIVKEGGQVAAPMNDPLVCVVLEGTTVESMLDEAARGNLGGADLAEVRYDKLFLIPPEESVAPASEEEEGEPQAKRNENNWERRDAGDIDVNAVIEELKEGIPIPVIFTCRCESEGGFYPGDEEARLSILEAAIDSGVSWVDLELSIDAEKRTSLHEKAKAAGVKVVASCHDQSGVPDTQSIVDLVKENVDSGDIIKLCYPTKNHHESLNLIEAAYLLRGEDAGVSIMGSGPGGDWNRLHAPLLEQAMVYTTIRTDFRLFDEGLINVRDARDAWVLLEY